MPQNGAHGQRPACGERTRRNCRRSRAQAGAAQSAAGAQPRSLKPAQAWARGGRWAKGASGGLSQRMPVGLWFHFGPHAACGARARAACLGYSVSGSLRLCWPILRFMRPLWAALLQPMRGGTKGQGWRLVTEPGVVVP